MKQLHREFLRSGADVMQTFTFYASDDKLSNRGNDAAARFTCKGINKAACRIAREVAVEGEKDGLDVMVGPSTGGDGKKWARHIEFSSSRDRCMVSGLVSLVSLDVAAEDDHCSPPSVIRYLH